MTAQGQFVDDGPPTVQSVSPDQIRHASPNERYGDVTAALAAQGRSLHDALGGNDRIPEGIMQGDWGQNDRGTDQFVPQAPPQPQRAHPSGAAVGQGPGHVDRGGVDPRTSAPLAAAPQPQPMQAQVPMGNQEYLAMTGNAAPFGPPTTPGEQYWSQLYGAAQNELGDMGRRMEDMERRLNAAASPPQAPAPSPEQAAAMLRTQLGLPSDDDAEIRAGDLANVLTNFATQLAVSQQEMMESVQDSVARASLGVDSAVRARIERDHPWVSRLRGDDYNSAVNDLARGYNGTNGAGAPPQTGYEQYQGHGAPPVPYGAPQTSGYMQVAPTPAAYPPTAAPQPMRASTFVERGQSMMNNAGIGAPMQRPSAAQGVLERIRAGEHVTTAEMAAALRSGGVDVPVRPHHASVPSHYIQH